MFQPREENPVYDLLMKQNRRFTQIAGLLAYLLIIIAIYSMRQMMIFSVHELILWMMLRWALGEFLFCWMTADHVFTQMGYLRRTRIFQETLLTHTTPKEIYQGIVRSNIIFICIGPVIWLICDLVTPWPPRVQFLLNTQFPGIQSLILVAYPIVMATNHIATIRMAAAYCTYQAFIPRQKSGEAIWALAMLKLGGFLLYATVWGLIAALFIAFLAGLGSLHALRFEAELYGLVFGLGSITVYLKWKSPKRFQNSALKEFSNSESP